MTFTLTRFSSVKHFQFRFCLIVITSILPFLGFARQTDIQSELLTKDTVYLSGEYTINQSLQIKKNVVIKAKVGKAILKTTGGFPLFQMLGGDLKIENLQVECQKFVAILSNINKLEVLNSHIIDPKNTGLSYGIYRGERFINIEQIVIKNCVFKDITPVFLDDVSIGKLTFNSNEVNNAIRYCIRSLNNQKGDSVTINDLQFYDNKINGININYNKPGVARLIQVEVKNLIDVQRNQIKNVNGKDLGGNYIYWSKGSLIFRDNYCENISGDTYAIHDKGVKGGNHIIENNEFVQTSYNRTKMKSILNLLRSSHYLIANNKFVNLHYSAIRISNPNSLSDKLSEDVNITGNEFTNINYPTLIQIIQSANQITIKDNKIKSYKTNRLLNVNGEIKPRFIDLFTSNPHARISNINIINNILINENNSMYLLYTNQVKGNSGKISNIVVLNNDFSKGGNLINFKNFPINNIRVKDNKIGLAKKMFDGKSPVKIEK